jgi:mitogen-activated protein kinase 1/3
MLQFDPRQRISVEEALAHPWLAQLHDEASEPSAPGWVDEPASGLVWVVYALCQATRSAGWSLDMNAVLHGMVSSSAGAFKFDFEEQDLDEAAVRQMVWDEMEEYCRR